jgi:hypothetical protein
VLPQKFLMFILLYMKMLGFKSFKSFLKVIMFNGITSYEEPRILNVSLITFDDFLITLNQRTNSALHSRDLTIFHQKEFVFSTPLISITAT